MKQTNVIIVGSGISALQLAKSLRCDINVIILTKSHVYNSNSFFAQGGVAAAIGKKDHPDKHYQDTLEAGRFHNDPEAVKILTREGPALINSLIAQGCLFDKGADGELLLGMEGAHSDHRIVHSGGDATGRNLIQFMTANVNQNITIMEDIFVFDLIIDESGERCIGIKGKYPDGRTETFLAEHIVLATGGCGQLFAYTSNAATVTGDGIALAYRAGAEITDMEFIQFHPTLLHIDGKAVGLISEAVRGEGGRLVTKEGKSIMKSIHPFSDLAPRHIVSQTIYHYLENGEPIFLDISSVKGFEERFPTITALCEQHGINIKEGLLPVAPGSHFLMGGIKTDILGRSSLEGLYAIGEAACTGIHGANRLASNSLLEGLFIGKKLAEWINASPIRHSVSLKSFEQSAIRISITKPLPSSFSIKKSMMENVGIIRTKDGLFRQKEWLESFHIINQLNANIDHLSIEEIEKVFMLITAWLVTESALKRTESRGGHFRQDYPSENDRDWLGKQIIHRQKKEKDDTREQIEAALAT